MTLIIILFLFQEQTRGGGTGRQGWWTGTSGMARKRADRLFFVFVRDVSRVCSPRWRVKCGFCGQGASRPRELARCPFPLCVFSEGVHAIIPSYRLFWQVWDERRSSSGPPVALMLTFYSCQSIFPLHDKRNGPSAASRLRTSRRLVKLFGPG